MDPGPLVSASDNSVVLLVSNVNNNRKDGRTRHVVRYTDLKAGEACIPNSMNLKQWLYKGGRPNRLAAIVNRFWAMVHALGISPNHMVTLEVRGRRSGRTVSLPLAMVVVEGERYLVSMLGTKANWVRNVNAAGGNVTLRHGRREDVRLEEVPADRRAPVLKAYLEVAPGARPHLPIQKDAPLSDFERVAPQFPVFRVTERSAE